MKSNVLKFLQREVELENIPGAVVKVSYKGEMLVQEAVGSRISYPNPEPMQLDTLFDLASLTKVVATLPVIMKLIQTGEIRLDDKVSFFLPSFRVNGKSAITIRHLLTHTSGLPAHRPFYKESWNTEEIIQQICKEAPMNTIGEKVIYSDLGLILLYKLIEIITQEEFTTFVKREIFDPLHMTETGFNLPMEKERFAATVFSEKVASYKQGIVHDENAESMGGISGHAGLFSTMKDVSRFAEMIESDGVYNGKEILPKSILQLSRKNFTPFDEEYRGLGWILKGQAGSSCGDLFSDTSYGHTGYTGTSLWFDPEIKLHVILLTNRVHGKNQEAILRLRPRLHNLIRSYF
ncbi:MULTISPECIES: serine hydrolase domain-containing protein [unclassified Bacillus (in: firmicutes)]|uniref:serine hydrolase domain-containing protein n=1 Tax=unclassified Bacillus (in: firmicutes) TaxID=185979 RepID=UPI0004E1523F|nr:MULTISPECIES: serine hydrolase domain-containing protein [unclassified Bacillus (in: firmicutes)]